MLSFLGCAEPEAVPGGPVVEDLAQMVPGEGLPAEVVDQPSHNNLDVIEHEGDFFLAFRTAPTHFASADTVMYVLRQDGDGWAYETRIALGTDVREPRFLSWEGSLFLYFAVLGDDPADFEPQGARVTVRGPSGAWTEPTDIFDDTFIPWRTRVVDGVPYLIGYTGGGDIYDSGEADIEVRWLTTEDGLDWVPVTGDGVVERGGGSETDWAPLDDGGLVAVTRNEAGDELGWGSKICRAHAEDLGNWACVGDPKKYDSPLLFVQGGQVWLLGRRNVTEDGNYDLGYREMDDDEETLAYEVAYWNERKRCSLWKVDPEGLVVTWVLDLPSRGDTCFPSAIDRGDGAWEVWNYSSPVDGPDPTWLEGQLGDTWLYRQILRFP